MSKWIEGQIECPFYIKEGERFIVCEGVIDGTQTVQRFKTINEKQKYEIKACSCKGGRSCPHYKSVYSLYDKGLRA